MVSHLAWPQLGQVNTDCSAMSALIGHAAKAVTKKK